ncbi:MAG TPA: hypothetical protein VMS02_00725 [Solirubrobacteraceae bacterium]|nr:hypothetical protein [Solirubrobacteraceae bacterium]
MSNNAWMQNDVVLPLVVYGATAVYVVSGVLSMFSRPNLYGQIGQGGLTGDADECVPHDALRERSRRLAAERDEGRREVRQLLEARRDRLARDGHAPLDVDTEIARLERAASLVDPRAAELVEEVRQLTIARNERRRRQGLAPLDVDTEIARALRESATI